MILVLDVSPECWGHVQHQATQVNTHEELLEDVCLYKAVASATAEKYFVKNRKMCWKSHKLRDREDWETRELLKPIKTSEK